MTRDDDESNGTKPVPLIFSRERGSSSEKTKISSAEEIAILTDLDTVIEVAIGSKPDFSGVKDAIRRARDTAATEQSHLLSQAAADIGISIAGDFETQQSQPGDEEEEQHVYVGWNKK